MAVDITPSALLEFAKTIKSGDQKSASSSVATVTRIDPDGVTYVSLPSGVDETPIATAGTVYNVGDTVYVTRSGGKLRANENLSSPSVGARVIKEASESLSKAVRIAKQAADEAGKVANAVNQHFWYDDNGAHVTDVTKDEWAAAVADNFSDLSDDKQYPNLLENSLGILLRSALNYLVSITRSAITFYDGVGNNSGNIIASFGIDGAVVGQSSGSHLEVRSNKVEVFSSATNSEAVFGQTTRIGLSTGPNIRIGTNAASRTTPSNMFISGFSGDDQMFSISAEYTDTTSTLTLRPEPPAIGTGSSHPSIVLSDLDDDTLTLHGVNIFGNTHIYGNLELLTAPLAIASGGTGMMGVTNATSGIFTAGSGITISSQKISIFGKVAQLELLIKHSSAWSVGTQYNVGTIASKYRPTQDCGGTMGTIGAAIVLSDGKVYCRPFINSELAANSQNYLRFTYILA